MKKRVTGFGGLLFKTQDPNHLRNWYFERLGVGQHEWGDMFEWRNIDHPEKKGYTVWSPHKIDSEYFLPSTHEFMVNFRVENLAELLPVLRAEGVTVIDEKLDDPYGKFAWILDPDGRKIELWEPNDEQQD